jgi:hypothetical protein
MRMLNQQRPSAFGSIARDTTSCCATKIAELEAHCNWQQTKRVLSFVNL